MKLILAIVFALSAATAQAATTYYASPTGSGTTCSIGSPCGIETLIETKPAAGDTLILLNGTYDITPGTAQEYLQASADGTISQRITLKAQNPHQAIVRLMSGSTRMLTVTGDYWTIQDIVWDQNSRDGFAIIMVWSHGNPRVKGTIVEGNILRNGGETGFEAWGAEDCIVRFNIIDDTGNTGNGEAFYISRNTATDGSAESVNNCEIYGNRTNNNINGMIDFKPGATNNEVHHNVFENQVLDTDPGKSGDGVSIQLVASGGSSASAANSFHDNIVRDSVMSGAGDALVNLASREVNFDSNVFYNITSTQDRALRGDFAGSNYTNNTHCSTGNQSTATNVGSTTGTVYDQAQGTCDAVVTRILSEMAALSNNPKNRWPGPTLVAGACVTASSTTIDCSWTNDYFPPISSADNTKFTLTRNGGGALTETGTVKKSGTTNVTTTTISETLISTDTILLSVAASGVFDSNNFLGISGFTGTNTPNAAISGFAVTNTLAGTSWTLTQSHYEGKRIPFFNGQLESLP